MIFDLVFKQVRHLFKSRRLFPIVHLPKVERQVLLLVFTRLITWLEANTDPGIYSIHSKSAALPGIRIFEPLCVYEPGLSTDKYDTTFNHYLISAPLGLS